MGPLKLGYLDMGPLKLGYLDMGPLKLGYLGYRDPPLQGPTSWTPSGGRNFYFLIIHGWIMGSFEKIVLTGDNLYLDFLKSTH